MNKQPFLLFFLFMQVIILNSCSTDTKSGTITFYPDSVVSDVSNHPVGINLDFFMDGGRFPDAERSVAEAIKEMGMKYLRYPGGEKSDLYLFSKPPYNKSQPGMARSGGLEDYPGMFTPDLHFVFDPLDFDEYIGLCRIVNAEPVVVVAADYYLIPLKEGQWVTSKEELLRHAVEWVRYANVKKNYHVRYWMIANESWNPNNVNSNAEIYAQDVIDFSMAMKEVDSTILIIANGDHDDFFKTVITRAGDHIDRLTTSNYGVWDFSRGYKTYQDTAQVLIRPALRAIKAMNTFATPEQLKRLRLIVAEFGSIDWARHWSWTNDMGHAIVTFDMAGQLLLQPLIEFSCFWNTRWIDVETLPRDHDALDKDGNLLPTGMALKIWGNFLGKQMIKSDTTGKILSFASYDPSSDILFAYLLNKGDTAETVTVKIENRKVESILEAWEYFGTSPEDIHPVWQEKKVQSARSISLKGTSITVLKIKTKHI